YNGKEFQDELNLNWYDYGARNYDPALGRWMNMDPLAEKFSPISPYIYVANNPLAFYDPDGKDIYHLDKNTGDIMLVEENDDETDQIVNARKNRKPGEYEVRRNKKGEIRKSSIKVNNIEKGILKDEINFQENSYVIEVGDDGQPSKEGVEAFALELSNYVNKEIQGGNLSKIDEDNISYVFNRSL
ncbi:MAG: RHS repeat-associated core domain-containing protein, partial [Moheibacter sp.]